MWGQIQVDQLASQLAAAAILYGGRFLGALMILVTGWLAAGWSARRIRSSASRFRRLDPNLVPVLAKATRLGVLILTLVAVLSQAGVQVTSLIALIGAAGVAVGLALQGTLINVASGLLLLTLRPFEIGDSVQIGDTSGVVDEVGLMLTRLHTSDNVHLSLPNSHVWGSKILNYSRNPTRRIDLVFSISYQDDIDRAIEVIRQECLENDQVLQEPQLLVAVGKLSTSSVDLLVRPWVRTPDYFSTRLQLLRAIKLRLDRESISIPYPRSEIQILSGPSSQPGPPTSGRD